ncbi:hypothetical protein SVIOM74S_08658 [Streptomyces violarus]
MPTCLAMNRIAVCGGSKSQVPGVGSWRDSAGRSQTRSVGVDVPTSISMVSRCG